MALPNPKSHRIALSAAADQVRSAGKRAQKGGLFLRKDLDALLAQPGCAGLRYYYGRNAGGQDTLILIGVDQDGNDQVQGIVMEECFLCPPVCGTANSLNS
jgi:hypothetical protein